MLKRLIVAFLSCVLATSVAAETLFIGAAAGYKKPLEALIAQFAQSSGHDVKRYYGNVSQALKQAEMDGRVDLVVGDETFIQKSGLSVIESVNLGQGVLVLAYRQGLEIKDLSQLAQLSVAMAEPKQAIFGQATQQWLAKHSNVKIGDLKMVSTIPQVLAYVSSGEVDAGFINLTEALASRSKIGGYLSLDAQDYTPIRIQAVRLDAVDAPALTALMDFLRSESAQQQLRSFGL
jgi:molybdate transport system substrate-binding protein